MALWAYFGYCEYRVTFCVLARLAGTPNHYYYDWLNPAAADFFANVLLNVTRATLPSGKRVLDYIKGGGPYTRI